MSSRRPLLRTSGCPIHRGFIARSGMHTAIGLALIVVFGLVRAHALLPAWLQHIPGTSAVESALYRAMQLPSAQALYPRPPKEAQAELARLIVSTPDRSELYELRARSDEDSLDFPTAEADWKLYAAHAQDPIAAQLELADFYHRRLQTADEVRALLAVAAASTPPSERFLAPSAQRSWQTFDRLLTLAADQALPLAQLHSLYEAFLTRYPDQPAIYARFLQSLLDERDFATAETLIARYRQVFPRDEVFPTRAQALLEYRRGNLDAALAVYDRAFQPLWPADLVQSWFALLNQTHRQRAMVADARARLAQQPDGTQALNALARIFFYAQQSGRNDQAQQTLDSFRLAREARRASWTATDLFTLVTLEDTIHASSESARYNFALASTPGMLPGGEPATQTGLSALIHLLLYAPDQPLALGAGNLTLYRDIATLDQGPGYWNGILSLWLNGTSPESEYNAETAKAQSYFHRAKAAELLSQLDTRYPAAPERAALHAQLIHVYADYNETAAVVADARQFLTGFPTAPSRFEVANLLADAYQRQGNSAAEFALYDSLLAELANRLKTESGGLPLTSAGPSAPPRRSLVPDPAGPSETPEQQGAAAPALTLGTYIPSAATLPDATEYAQLLDRYLGRLTAEKRLPQALAVLRRQLDLNPSEPLLYERLATFLQQNNLAAAEEDLYKSALARFGQRTWYDKLGRFYLRQRRRQAFVALTQQVTGIFSGLDLDAYFTQVPRGSGQQNGQFTAQLALQLNLFAAKRFPHDLVFTRNLLALYSTRPTTNAAAWEALLRQHWWEDDDLRNQFFASLSRTGKLPAELSKLAQPTIPGTWVSTSPAAARELAEAYLWTSHFEQAAPLLGPLASLYPANLDLDDRAVSLFRSLSYQDSTPASLNRAVLIEKNLASAEPGNPDRLATLGDLYAEATATGGEDLHAAAPFWQRIPALHPGLSAGYLNAATIFWDYFQFADAQAELRAARDRFQQPALFGYEMGAIDENRRDLPAAVAEYTSAAIASDAATEARARLLQLAGRPASRALADQATARAFAEHPTSPAALTLRVDLLATQHRQAEIAPVLTAALARTSTPEQAAGIGSLAQVHSLPAVYEASLTQQIALTPDPVSKLEFSYTLAASYEARKDLPDASRTVDAVYRANPRTLGVVRRTTDFYLRIHQPPRAIATLLEAANAARPANPQLARSFTLQAASHANEFGDTAQARTLALTLLPATPYDPQVLAVLATSYARAGDDLGLRTFYESQLTAVRTAQLTSDQRKADTALLRRGLVPALTRLKDFPGALNQYIALLSAYPEDSATAQQAALYALAHSLQPQLVTFLQTTVQQSPRDSRFAILLAEVDTIFEDLPGAVQAYNAAIAIRKDRADLYEARANLELRLGLTDPAQLEAAAQDFTRLFTLSYQDPAWMVRLAELRTRQNRPADAVRALQAAYLTGHPASASNLFAVASHLEQWNLLPEARSFAEQGATLAGPQFLVPATSYGEPSGPVTYARILTRAGHPEQALAALTQARAAVDTAPLPTSSSEDATPQEAAQFRQNALANRRMLADNELRQAVAAAGNAIQIFYTPEQKLAYAQTLDRLHASNSGLALAGASSAGLTDREAGWRKQILLTGPLNSGRTALTAGDNLSIYSELERRRLNFVPLAQTLEAFAARLTPEARPAILRQAADAYRDAGDDTDELRLTRQLALANDPGLRDRFFDLLLRRDPAALNALAASPDASLADAAVNYALANTGLPQTSAALSARKLSPLWHDASYALAALYFAPQSPDGILSPIPEPTRTTFTRVLRADDPIGDRLAHPSDPAQFLTGNLWFFYASRFGVALSATPPSPDPAVLSPEDYLPAELEQTPTLPTPYLHLARTYAEVDHLPQALTEYNHALELAPAGPSAVAIHDEIALLLFRSNRRDEALAEWRTALAELLVMQQHAEYPEQFFTTLATIEQHLGERNLFATLQPEVEAILRGYFAKNGSYRSNELLRAVYTASSMPAAGTALLLSLANAAPDPNDLLEDLRRVGWITPESREAILQRQITLARNRFMDAPDSRMAGYQRELVRLYVDHNQLDQAQAVLDSIAASPVSQADDEDRILIAVRTGHLERLLDTWRANPDSVPTAAILASTLYYLRRPTSSYTPNLAQIRPLQEFVFERKQLAHALVPTDFVALAQVRLDTNDLPGALDLLRRLTLQPTSSYETGTLRSPDAEPNTLASDPSMIGPPPIIAYGGPTSDTGPSTNIDYAAALLERTHHPAEALPFLTMLVQSVPWNAAFRLRLAEAQRDANHREAAIPLLNRVLTDGSAPYDIRASAAADLRDVGATPVPSDSRELTLLASASPTTASVRQPYFARARIALADRPATPAADQTTLLREAIAITPDGDLADQARLNLLLLAGDNDSPASILTLLTGVQRAQPLAPAAREADANASETADQAAPEITGDLTLPNLLLPPLANALPFPARIHLAQLLSSAYQRDHQNILAFGYAQLAVKLSGPQSDPTLLRRRDELRAAVTLDRLNAARRPVFHTTLDQQNQVRQRLIASNPPRLDPARLELK